MSGGLEGDANSSPASTEPEIQPCTTLQNLEGAETPGPAMLGQGPAWAGGWSPLNRASLRATGMLSGLLGASKAAEPIHCESSAAKRGRSWGLCQRQTLPGGCVQ